nr:MAG TPA: Internal virion protein D [Caudoviricetes sp.]
MGCRIMPIYPQSDVPPSIMDNALQAPAGFDVSLPEGTNPEPQQKQPSVWNAAFRQNNLLAGMFRPAKQFEPAEGYNPYSDKNELKGYEQWGTAFADSRSPEETAWIKNQIDDENEDRRVLSEAGPEGTLASIAAGVIDPVTVASMFIPGAQGSLAARIGSQVAIGAAGTALSEVALNNEQYTRTARESAAHITAGALLSGLFASAGSLISPGVRSAATREMADALENIGTANAINRGMDSLPDGGSVGAMRIRQATLDDLTIDGGKAADIALKAGGYMTPISRVISSPSRNARITALELAENSFALRGNQRGFETPVAAETRVRGWRREEAAVVVTNKQAYAKYKADGGDLNYTRFREEVGDAMRNGDIHGNAAVQDAARALRQVVDRVKVAQQDLGLLPPDAELKALGQTSYFPRVYRVGKIVEERDKFRDLLVNWWSRGASAMSREDAEIAADATINKIVGAKIPQDFMNVFTVKVPGSSRQRTLNLPDNMMRDYLESDANYVLQRHIREASPDIELTRVFGNRNLEPQLKAIQDEYDELMRARPQEQAKLAKARENDIRDITAMRDRLVGTYGMPDDPSSFFVRAGRAMRNVNFVTKLGGMTVSAIPDLARGVMVNGFSKTMKGYGALISKSPAFAANKSEMKKMGIMVETVLNSRSRLMADLVDSSTRTNAAEAGLDRVTDVFGKLTLMGQYNDINKAINGMVTADSILSGAAPASRIAKLGISPSTSARINEQFRKYGEVLDGWHIGNFDKWDDDYAAGVFQSAVMKDTNNIIITPGVGDTPLWASSPIGRTVFQFRSFTTASYNRATIGGLSEGTAQFYYGTAFQIALGALTYALKQAANGKEIDWSPQKLALEGIDRSGFLGPLMEYNNMAEKATGGALGLGSLLGTGTQSRYASRGFVGSVIGPTFGLLDTVTDVTAGVLNGDAGDRVLHSVRTLLPGNNLFWIAPLINQVDPGMR